MASDKTHDANCRHQPMTSLDLRTFCNVRLRQCTTQASKGKVETHRRVANKRRMLNIDANTFMSVYSATLTIGTHAGRQTNERARQ